MSWYMAVRTDFDHKDGYRPSWNDGAHIGTFPAGAMRHADESHVYLMWHMETPQPQSMALTEHQIPEVPEGDVRMVIKDKMGRVLMLDGCHLDELVFTRPDRSDDVHT